MYEHVDRTQNNPLEGALSACFSFVFHKNADEEVMCSLSFAIDSDGSRSTQRLQLPAQVSHAVNSQRALVNHKLSSVLHIPPSQTHIHARRSTTPSSTFIPPSAPPRPRLPNRNSLPSSSHHPTHRLHQLHLQPLCSHTCSHTP